MLRDLRFDKLIFPLIALFFLSAINFAQDLGSSNNLFGNPKSSPKKVASKPKAAPVKKAAPPKLARRVKKAAPPKVKTNQSQTIEIADKNTQKTPPENNIVITVGDKTSGDFDELFEKAIDEGNNARDSRDYTTAEAAYLRAQSLKAKDSRAILGLGNLYSDQQRWEEAERAYRSAIELDPTSPQAHVALSYVLMQPIIGTNLAARFTEAEKLARRAIELEPNSAFAYDQLGVTLELSGKVRNETENAYRRAIELDPKFALAYAHLGRLLRRLGSVDESNAAYQSAIENSIDVPTQILVAEVMQTQQKYAESENLLRRALGEDEKNPTALYLLGRALTAQSKFDEAEKVLKKSAEVSPQSFVSYTLLGSLSLRRSRIDDAERYLMQAIKVVSLNEKRRLAQEFEAVGDAYLNIGKNADAARIYRYAVALDKDKAVLNKKLAKAQEK